MFVRKKMDATHQDRMLTLQELPTRVSLGIGRSAASAGAPIKKIKGKTRVKTQDKTQETTKHKTKGKSKSKGKKGKNNGKTGEIITKLKWTSDSSEMGSMSDE